jgi:hypothetical protein
MSKKVSELGQPMPQFRDPFDNIRHELLILAGPGTEGAARLSANSGDERPGIPTKIAARRGACLPQPKIARPSARI